MATRTEPTRIKAAVSGTDSKDAISICMVTNRKQTTDQTEPPCKVFIFLHITILDLGYFGSIKEGFGHYVELRFHPREWQLSPARLVEHRLAA